MKHACDDTSFGYGSGVPRQVKGDLAMEGRFGLKEREQDFGQTFQGIDAAVRETGFQMDG
ncbi:hypothetical protein ACFFLM_11200 [Deinococcus oregonensis]|uniref:Uncharacterized protein n=1 Tax=Deinococcus oregonensis TaxID=1805970 RepID=A0ABV6AYF8_9DEIO